MRTSFHHQSEAQHPKSSAIHKYAGRLPHLWVISGHRVTVPFYVCFTSESGRSQRALSMSAKCHKRTSTVNLTNSPKS